LELVNGKFERCILSIFFILCGVILISASQLSLSSIPKAYARSPTLSSSCIVYNAAARVITITCSSATLTDIYNHIRGNNILIKQSADGVWLLSADLIVSKGATLRIDSGDTKWLRISSDATGTGRSTTTPYSIDVHGSLKINSVKITSWNTLTNNYATTNGTRHDPGVGKSESTVPGAPRPFITVEKDATGTTDLTNSEIAYLGYEKGNFSGSGTAGLNYYGGDGSILRGNDIHNLYFGFYSSGVGKFVIEYNHIHDNTIYGLDPHTGTHDTIIRNNVVHDNGQFGIICSLNCNNVTIENNEVYHNSDKNTGAGIMFSRNMVNSVARNNNVHDEPAAAISISASQNNQIYNNTISNSGNGINLKNSSNIRIHDNTVINSSSGLNTDRDSRAGNIIYNNQFVNTPSSHSTNPDAKTTTNNQKHEKLKSRHHK
jgi:parallel beta-helix repeat protein